MSRGCSRFAQYLFAERCGLDCHPMLRNEPIPTHSVVSRVCVLTCLVLLASQWGALARAADPDCTLLREGMTVTLAWTDEGGRHVVRRNGDWLATLGAAVSSFIDNDAPPDAEYLIRTRVDGTSTDRRCSAPGIPDPDVPAPDGRRFVVHVSMDGLRADYVTSDRMANLSRLAATGASTFNARTDPAITKTLPNHTSQFTGQFVWGPAGHRITVNDDPGGTLHDAAGRYVPSIFDVVHDHGGRTVVYAGKSKFFLHERSWNEQNGAPDQVGEDDGRDKIDVFVKEDPTIAAQPFVADLVAGDAAVTYGFFHVRTPDSAGHTWGWSTDGYLQGVRDADMILGELLAALDAAGVRDATTIIVTADHGGPAGGDDHGKQDLSDNYTVPFVVSGPGVAVGADLYALNLESRTDPGIGRPNKAGPQPIRGHDVANLSLDILGLPPIPGSVVNADQSLRVN